MLSNPHSSGVLDSISSHQSSSSSSCIPAISSANTSSIFLLATSVLKNSSMLMKKWFEQRRQYSASSLSSQCLLSRIYNNLAMVIISISEVQISSPSSSSLLCKSWIYPSRNHFLILYFLARSILSTTVLNLMNSERASTHVFRIWAPKKKRYKVRKQTYEYFLWQAHFFEIPHYRQFKRCDPLGISCRLTLTGSWAVRVIMSQRSLSSNRTEYSQGIQNAKEASEADFTDSMQINGT